MFVNDPEMIDDDEQLEQEVQFSMATEHVMRKAKIYDAKNLLELYGLYKQATEGACHTSRPSLLQMKARSKWNAWHELGDMSTEDAQRAYIDKVHTLDPNWLNDKSGRNMLSGWVVHSIESAPVEETNSPDRPKTLFDHVKENNLQCLREELTPDDLAILDDQGMALLHWATDRNALSIIEYLVKCGANVDQRDGEQQTPLHYAASCGHVEAVRCLLSLNAELELCDADGQTCIDVADDEEICAILQAELQQRKGYVAN